MKNEEQLGFLEPLLVFPLQRDRRGLDTPQLTATGTAGDGSEVPPCCRHRGFGKTARNGNTCTQAKQNCFLQVHKGGWPDHTS